MAFDFHNQFYIVRHGKAENNELRIEACKLETQKAFGLTDEGKAVVAEESRRYTNFDTIYSSPFRRTQETAAYFAHTSHCDVILDDRLLDIDIGDLDLQSYEISRAASQEHPQNDDVYPNGESRLHVLDRLISFMKDVNAHNKDKNILIVSHGFPCETLLDWSKGKPLKEWEKCLEKGKVFSLNP